MIAPPRRWFRYSLRTLFVVMTLCACWLGWRVSSLSRQWRAVAAIREAGGTLASYSPRTPAAPGIQQPFIEPDWTSVLFGGDQFASIYSLKMRRAEDRDLQFVGELTALQDVRLQDPKITVEGWVSLARLSNLKRLDLRGANVSGAGLDQLRNLPKLQRLGLGESQVTDADLQHFPELASLTFLELYDTEVTDAGLEHLRELKKLSILDLRNTQVTPAGVAAIKTALPACSVQYDDPP